MVEIFPLRLITSALSEIITKHTSIITEVSKRYEEHSFICNWK